VNPVRTRRCDSCPTATLAVRRAPLCRRERYGKAAAGGEKSEDLPLLRKASDHSELAFRLSRRWQILKRLRLGIFFWKARNVNTTETNWGETMQQAAPSVGKIIEGIHSLEPRWFEDARRRTAQLIMPPRALGRLHDIAERICAIQQSLEPDVTSKAVVVMAADHGIAAEGVSAFPQEVTAEMIKAFITGGAGINVLADLAAADIVVVDAGIVPELDPAALNAGRRLRVHKTGAGTANISRGPAMSAAQAVACLQTGYAVASELIQGGVRLLGTGDMGIGNTTASAAVGAVITGADLASMVGRGTGIDDRRLEYKTEMIRTAIEVNRPRADDGLDVLAKVGGFEIGGIAGCILAAAAHRVPVVVDGFISTAGALIARTLCPAAVEYMIAGHRSEESGHGVMLDFIRLEPILDLGMRLGEGTGGALAMGIIEGAVRIFNRMLTFEQAGVSKG